jgi:uncharacterized phage-associated protein
MGVHPKRIRSSSIHGVSTPPKLRKTSRIVALANIGQMASWPFAPAPSALLVSVAVIPTTVHDIAAYIVPKQGPMTALKLQKLVYYAQAWSLVWDERPLFSESIEAWANGPVVRELYDRHRGQYTVHGWKGNVDALDAAARETIDAVLSLYGSKDSHWLSNLTHQEDPWKNARVGLRPGDRGDHEITHAAMHEYYSSLS